MTQAQLAGFRFPVSKYSMFLLSLLSIKRIKKEQSALL